VSREPFDAWGEGPGQVVEGGGHRGGIVGGPGRRSGSVILVFPAAARHP
jgi:hypothetical protein